MRLPIPFDEAGFGDTGVNSVEFHHGLTIDHAEVMG